jgi:predicted GNAT superfamily acetyltransferase
LKIEELQYPSDLRELADLFSTVWGRAGEHPIGPDILRALSYSGNYVAGAREGELLVGGIVGWLGGGPPADLHLHSHILAVLPNVEARGLGFHLKQHQRDWCLARDILTVEWTFDPLVRRNAYFNLTKLGAEAARYLVNFYGAMDDRINAGEESDRILIRWELKSEKAVAAAAARPHEPDADRLQAKGAVPILAVGAGDEPQARHLEGKVALCQVPEDIVALRRAKPDLARRWRRAVREALGSALEHGYRVTAATRTGWYVLEA